MQNEKNLDMALRGLGTLLLALCLPACSDGDSGGFQPARPVASGTPTNMGAPQASVPGGQGGMLGSGDPGIALEWDLPQGWSALPTNNFRQANFKLPGEAKAECYLSLLGGEAGGLASNVDRWRTQIGLGALPPDELAKLTHVMLLGRDGVVVDFAGTWKGMGGTENNANWRLVGILQVDAQGSAFFKMYGPDALIESEKEHFLTLARSLRPSHAGFSGGAAPAPQPAPQLTPPQANPPAAGPTPMAPTDPAVASMAGDQQGLAWMAPGNWTKGAENKMRTVTYSTGTGAECYVTVIPGDAGGVGANINRWRGQLGCPALSADEVEKLAHLSICGVDGRMALIEGAGDSATKGMLGALALVNGRSIFVKMTGPKDAVQKETENFKAFAQSLKEAK